MTGNINAGDYINDVFVFVFGVVAFHVLKLWLQLSVLENLLPVFFFYPIQYPLV